jgi:hypothetical protein
VALAGSFNDLARSFYRARKRGSSLSIQEDAESDDLLAALQGPEPMSAIEEATRHHE